MAEMVKIRKGRILNVVPLEAFNTLYKAAGWEVESEEAAESELSREISGKGIIDENQQNAYIRAKHERARRQFDDRLFKGE